MKTFTSILKTIVFAVAYFIVISIIGTFFPTAKNVEPDAMAFGAILLFIGINSYSIYYLLTKLRLKGFKLIANVVFIVFGLQIFMTQLETFIFIKSFPQITTTVLFNIVISNLLTIIIMTILGYFFWGKKNLDNPITTESQFTKHNAFKLIMLSVAYMVLYFSFGSLIPWQLEEARNFYQASVSSMSNFNLALIQIGRGFIWALICWPAIIYNKGLKAEKITAVALMMALLPTILLFMPNPYMSFTIRMAHFVEIFLSNGIFGFLISYAATTNFFNKRQVIKTVIQ